MTIITHFSFNTHFIAPFDSYSRRVRHDTAQSVGNRFHHRDSVFNNSVADIKYRDPKTDGAGSSSGYSAFKKYGSS